MCSKEGSQGREQGASTRWGRELLEQQGRELSKGLK